MGGSSSTPASDSLRPGARCGGARPLATLPVTLVVLAITAAVLAGCSPDAPASAVQAGAHDRLEPGITYSADLDADGMEEQVLIKGTPPALTINDGDVIYRSRERWQVVEAHLGDTNSDGLLEIVALVDDDEGRHLGIFSYHREEYGERLVSSEIVPRPVALQVVGPESAVLDPAVATTLTGDAILLTLEPRSGQTGTTTMLCRWNGFSFTGIENGL